MKIAKAQEESIYEKKLWLGVENFSIVAVNPTKEELNEMGIPANEEPVYVKKQKYNFNNQGEQECDVVNIRLFLDNKDENNPIKTQASFNIIKDHQKSSTGKFLVLNKYGSSTWLDEKFIGAELPSNMQWYLNEDVKKALRGEDRFIDLIKSYFNLPYINKDTEEAKKEAGIAIFGKEDLAKLFKGDFSDIRKILMVNGKDQQVGFLMGVREVEGEYKQTLYTRMPLKSYVAKTGKTKRLIEDVVDAQANNAYADAIFDTKDTSVKEFDEKAHTQKPSGEIGGSIDEEEDDLPF